MEIIRKALAVLRGFASRVFRPRTISGGLLFREPGCRFIFGSDTHIDIDGKLKLGANCLRRNGRSTILRMDAGSKLVTHNSSFYYGADIILFEGAQLIIGESFINSDSRIRVHRSITIGDGCAISHGFVAMDGNAHAIDGRRTIAPVVIKNHVWIGTGVTVLPGVTIGEGAVIAAGSVVTKDIPPSCLAAGVPARVVRESISWEK